MSEPCQERRKARPFRILYIPFQLFIERFILRREAVPRLARPVEPEPAPTKAGAQLLKTGVPRIDLEQEGLFDAIRTLQAASKAGAVVAGITRVLTFLEHYTEEHLPLEETHMEHIKYPGLAVHRNEHQAFRQQVNEFQGRAAGSDATLRLELINALHGWIREHVMREDVAYCEFAQKNRHR